MKKCFLQKMGYAFVALCLLSSTAVLTTACGDDEEELEYREEQPEEKEENSKEEENPKEEGEGNKGSTGTVGEAIDLGLSVMWASHNVGAAKPEEYGNYFAWGETTPKDDYSWDTYKYGLNSFNLTKYCTSSGCGTLDNKTVLEASDDAATANWGNGWRMPTFDEMRELFDKCTWTWITQNGVNGRLVTGPNGNSIFLPATGERYDTSIGSAGEFGCYWSSSLYLYESGSAYGLLFGIYFTSNGHVQGRASGYSVRPVRASAQN